MRAVFTSSPVESNQIPKIRFWFFIGWVILIGIIPLSSESFDSTYLGEEFHQFFIALYFASIPLGWIFGYRNLISPLFAGCVIIHEPRNNQGK